MTLEQIVQRVAKMSATGADQDVVEAARKWVDEQNKVKAKGTLPKKALQSDTE